MFANRSSRKRWDEDKPADPLKDKVDCSKCYCLLTRYSAHTVTLPEGSKLFYCGICKPPYDEMILPGWHGVPLEAKPRYFGRVQVTADGVPIGYVKKSR